MKYNESNDYRRMYLDARRKYNDGIVDMILAGIKKLETFTKNRVLKHLENAAKAFNDAANGDFNAFKRGEKDLAAAERIVKVCIKISEGLLKIAQKFGK